MGNLGIICFIFVSFVFRIEIVFIVVKVVIWVIGFVLVVGILIILLVVWEDNVFIGFFCGVGIV